nr:reverse transcriptase domain-containing protein [Tanacetum cinerariifolium]
MEGDIKENKNEPELTYPYKEMDPLIPPLPASESEPKDVTEVKNPIKHDDETVPASVHEVAKSSNTPFLREDNDGILLGLMRRDINSLFGQMASLSRRLCGRETAHALVEKKGKAKDKYYDKLILNLGNEVRSSVEQGTAAMEKLVEKLSNAEDKRARHANAGNDARGSGLVRGQDAARVVRECNFARFMKCNPTAFHDTKGVVELQRWFEKTKSVFGISECVERKKTVNEMPWIEMKQIMNAEFCMIEEVLRMEHELWNLKGEVTSSKPANLNEVLRMAHKLMEQKLQARDEIMLEGKKRKWESFQSGSSSVGKFTFPVDFVILEMEEDNKVPLILGRPFLHIVDAVIRFKQKQLNLGAGTKRMIFNIDSVIKDSYSNDNTCFSIDDILEEDFDAPLDEGSKILHSIKGTILEEENISEFDKFIAMTVDENYDSESDIEETPFEKITINTDYKIKTSLEEPPMDLEFKPLPNNLEYVFLEEPSFLLVIISCQLSGQNKSKLLYVLKKHKEAFAWKTTDIPGIRPSFRKHKIQLLDDKKPVEKQRRLNPNMEEVVKKEIVKLLDTAVPLDGLHVDDKLHFVEEPVEIMDREVKRLKRSCIPLVKDVVLCLENGWEGLDEIVIYVSCYEMCENLALFIAPTATTTTVTEAQLQALINQGVAAAMAEAEASRWFEKMESVFNISNCTVACQVKYAACTLQGVTLTWWNSHVKTVTLEVAQALPWKTLKEMMTDKYCPKGEIKKLKTEIWELKTKGTDVIGYSCHFQELALMCDRTFSKESDRVEKYIDGLPDMIHDSVKATRPKTMQEAIEFATELMDKRIRDAVENNRKFKGTFGNNQNQPQQNKRQNTGRAYAACNSDRNIYIGSKPLRSKCDYHHKGPCPPRCNNCKRVGHLTRDCRSRPANANNNNNTNDNNCNKNNNNQKGNDFYECGAQGHFKRNFPKLKNNNRGNQGGNDNAQARVYVIGNARANPDNVVAATFLLNNHYAYILFDTGADRSFVSTTFSSQIDIALIALDHHYNVEIAYGRIIRLNTIMRDCTLNFLNHPFNMDLLSIEQGTML